MRGSIGSALAAMGGVTVEDNPGRLTMDLGGSVGSAYLAGPFRNKWKLPLRIVVTTSGLQVTDVAIDVHSRGTASGFASGGLIGANKQKRAEQAWLSMAIEAVPNRLA